MVLACHACLVAGSAATSGGGARLAPSCCVCSLACVLALVAPLLPFRLVVGGALLVFALFGLLCWWLDLLPFQFVVGGPCSVPACHACLVAGCAATSAGGRRCPPGGCLLGLLAWWWLDCFACLLNALVCQPLLLSGEGAVPAWCLCALLAWRPNLLLLLLVGGGSRLVPTWRCLLGGRGPFFGICHK